MAQKVIEPRAIRISMRDFKFADGVPLNQIALGRDEFQEHAQCEDIIASQPGDFFNREVTP